MKHGARAIPNKNFSPLLYTGRRKIPPYPLRACAGNGSGVTRGWARVTVPLPCAAGRGYSSRAKAELRGREWALPWSARQGASGLPSGPLMDGALYLTRIDQGRQGASFARDDGREGMTAVLGSPCTTIAIPGSPPVFQHGHAYPPASTSTQTRACLMPPRTVPHLTWVYLHETPE